MTIGESFPADFDSDQRGHAEKLPIVSDDEITAAAQMAGILGDDTRMGILRMLFQDGETSVIDLQRRLAPKMTQGGFSHQLRVLRHRQMVDYGREGNHNMYYLTETGNTIMQKIQNLISSMQEES